MSVFSNIFGRKKEAAAPSPQESMQQLRETEDMLMKKQEFLEKKVSSVSFIIGGFQIIC